MAEKHHIAAADLGHAGNHPVAWDPPGLQPEARRAMGGEDVELLERVAVDQPGDALARRQLVLGVLALESLSVAVAGFVLTLPEQVERIDLVGTFLVVGHQRSMNIQRWPSTSSAR